MGTGSGGEGRSQRLVQQLMLQQQVMQHQAHELLQRTAARRAGGLVPGAVQGDLLYAQQLLLLHQHQQVWCSDCV